MEIKLQKIKIKDLINDYKNNQDEWVSWYNWKLDIRPKYQREFIYKPDQQKSVIDTILKWFPLNVMYWVIKDNSIDEYEVLDWQQRTMSICEYVVSNNFSIEINWKPFYFHSLTNDEQNKILDYELMIYFCEWSDKEKLDWFRIINIAWVKLTNQELRNAVYTWTWLSDAKKYFSKTNCSAYELWNKYINWSPIRQEYLEIVLDWISNWEIEEYMAKHQHDKDAIELWNYFEDVISWIKKLFPEKKWEKNSKNNPKKEMRWLPWWELYNEYKDKSFNSNDLENKLNELIIDDEVSDKKWIYQFLITWDQKYLNLRSFSDNQKREVYEKQKGICLICEKNNSPKIHYEIEDMEADHIMPWHEWWKTDIANCQMLCKKCNRTKSWK